MSSKKKKPEDDTAAADQVGTEAAPTTPLPTRGRILDFTSAEANADTYPAIVSQVAGDELHLTVFDAVFGPRLVCASLSNNERVTAQVGTWAWPVRV